MDPIRRDEVQEEIMDDIICDGEDVDVLRYLNESGDGADVDGDVSGDGLEVQTFDS